MRLTIFFISRTKKVEAKTLAVLKVYSNKGNVFLLFHFFEILLKSAITFKQILLHGNGIVQYLQNYKWPKFNQNHFRKPSQGSTNTPKSNCSNPTYAIFTDRLIFSYILCLSCCNFRITFTKPTKLHYLESALESLKTRQNSHAYGYPRRDYGPLKILIGFLAMFFTEKCKR